MATAAVFSDVPILVLQLWPMGRLYQRFVSPSNATPTTKNMAKITIFIFSFLLVSLIRNSESRYLQSNSSLLSDGVDDNIDDQSPLQLFRGGLDLESQSECSHMYGFLPCSDNLLGHVFQIVVYEYLSFLGESYVSLGSEIVFTILGTGLFGASAFHILGALPQAMITIDSGLSKTKELAQASVMTGFGMLAGSTTFLLTLLWGTCLVFGSSEFSTKSKSKDSETPISYITDSGVIIDTGTNYSARILFISLVPIIILQIPTTRHHLPWTLPPPYSNQGVSFLSFEFLTVIRL